MKENKNGLNKQIALNYSESRDPNTQILIVSMNTIELLCCLFCPAINCITTLSLQATIHHMGLGWIYLHLVHKHYGCQCTLMPFVIDFINNYLVKIDQLLCY